MTDELKPIIINRKVDTGRISRLEKPYLRAGLDYEILSAIDAHLGAKPFRKYVNLIAPHFWGQEHGKPGAIACFISHFLAWKAVVQGDAPYRIITEDDSRPLPGLKKFRPEIEKYLENFDILFINNRLSEWASKGGDNLRHIIQSETALETDRIAQSEFRAPGADAYILTKDAARALIRQAKIDKTACGVDWYLVYCCLDSREGKDIREENIIPQLDLLQRILGERQELLRGRVFKPPLFRINKSEESTIIHSKYTKITDLL